MTRKEFNAKKYYGKDYDQEAHHSLRQKSRIGHKPTKWEVKQIIADVMATLVLMIWITTLCMLDSSTLIPAGIFVAATVYLTFYAAARGWME